jgi:hypothetical protein
MPQKNDNDQTQRVPKKCLSPRLCASAREKKKNSIPQRRRDAEKGLKDQDIQQACDHYLSITRSRLTIPQNATRSPKMPFSAPPRLCARKKQNSIPQRRRDAEKGLKDQDIQQACDHYLSITRSRLTIPQNATRSPKMPFSAPPRLCARKKQNSIALRRRDAEKRL